jgi:hypothetical protein
MTLVRDMIYSRCRVPIPEAVYKAENGKVKSAPKVALLFPAERQEVEDWSQASIAHQFHTSVHFCSANTC